jgi:hypothetical protein
MGMSLGAATTCQEMLALSSTEFAVLQYNPAGQCVLDGVVMPNFQGVFHLSHPPS